MWLSENKKNAIDRLRRAIEACDGAGLYIASKENELVLLERKEVDEKTIEFGNRREAVKKSESIEVSESIENWIGSFPK